MNEKAISLFDNILEQDDLKQAKHEDTETECKEAEPKKEKKKKSGTKIRIKNLAKDTDSLKLSVIDNEIVNSAEVDSFETDKIKVDISDSWVGLLGFLVGAIENKYKDEFISKISSKNVFGNYIKLSNNNTVHLDSDEIELYNITDSDTFIEVYSKDEIIDSIKECFSILEIKFKDVILNLRKIEIKGEKDSSYIIVKKSLAELINGVPDIFIVDKAYIEDSAIEVNNLKHAILIILSYIISENKNTIPLLSKYTIKDIIGVTNDNQSYFGLMQTVKLPSTDLYFYTNGLSLPMLEYLSNICIDTGNDINTIYFEFKTLEGLI